MNWTWNNELVPNWERSTSRLYIVTSLFNLDAEYIIRNAGLDETQPGIKIAGRTIDNLRYANTTVMAEIEAKLKNLLIKVKEKRKSLPKTQTSKNEDHGIWSHHGK